MEESEANGFPPKKEEWSEAMQRLLAPSLREKSNALNVARIALAGLDDMIAGMKENAILAQFFIDFCRIEKEEIQGASSN